MAALFGKQWESSYGSVGDAVYLTWEEALTSNYTTEQVRRGYSAMMQEGSEFPPNLIKFLRMCRSTDPYSTHTQTTEKLDRPLPRYSVRRIELMKQQFLFGGLLTVPECPEGFVDDWTSEDEALLIETMSSFKPDTPLEVVNRTVDWLEFSHGTQRKNAYVI